MSRLFPKGKTTSRVEPLTRPHGVGRYWAPIGRGSQEAETGLARACSQREARGRDSWPTRRAVQARGGRGPGGGHALWRPVFWFAFFFRERSLPWPRLKAAASFCSLLHPSTHTSLVQIAKRLLYRELQFLLRARLAHLVRRSACVLLHLQLQRTGRLIWSPTRPDRMISLDFLDSHISAPKIANPWRS